MTRSTSLSRRLAIGSFIAALAGGASNAARVLVEATAATTHLVTPIAVTDIHPCTGEQINLVGEIRWVFHIGTDAAGGQHLTTRSNAHAAGMGVNGTRYHFKDVATSVTKLSVGAQLVEEFVLSHHVIGQGQVPDFQLREWFHLTVTANGEVATVLDRSESTCG